MRKFLSILNPKSYTLATPYTLHPAYHTLNTTPYALHTVEGEEEEEDEEVLVLEHHPHLLSSGHSW